MGSVTVIAEERPLPAAPRHHHSQQCVQLLKVVLYRRPCAARDHLPVSAVGRKRGNERYHLAWQVVITDPVSPKRRGQSSDAAAWHNWLFLPFSLCASSKIATCHLNVLNCSMLMRKRSWPTSTISAPPSRTLSMAPTTEEAPLTTTVWNLAQMPSSRSH